MSIGIALAALLLPACSHPSPDPAKTRATSPMEIDPTILAHQLKMDEATLEALEQAGAHLSKPHRLEHHFQGSSLESANSVRSWGVANGFVAPEVNQAAFGGEDYVVFDLVRPTIPTLERITAQTTAMLEVARRHGLVYDGWGTDVEE